MQAITQPNAAGFITCLASTLTPMQLVFDSRTGTVSRFPARLPISLTLLPLAPGAYGAKK